MSARRHAVFPRIREPRNGSGRSWLASRWERLNGDHRIAGVDLARGIAVVGMLAAHLLTIDDFDWAQPATWADIASGRSSILFATLAGVSMGLVTGGREPVRGTPMRVARERLAVRAVLLMVIGILLVATGVPVYVILPAYAILFVLGLPFTGLGARGLFVAAAIVGLAGSLAQPWLDALPVWSTDLGEGLSMLLGWHYPFTVWLAFVLAGMASARLDLRRAATQWRLLAAGAALALAGYGLHAVGGSDPVAESASYWGAVWTARPHSSGLLEVVGSGGFALAALAVCLIVCRTPAVWVVLPLRAVGAMPLTAYVAQVVVWAVWAQIALGSPHDLSGFRALDPFVPIALGILVGCTAWALLVGRGPLEALTALVTRVVVPGGRRRAGLWGQ